MDWLINGYLGKPGEGKLWNVECHSGSVSRRNGLIFTTGSKIYVTGGERSQLRTAIASAPTLIYYPFHQEAAGSQDGTRNL